MKLIIAEKNSLAKAAAEALGNMKSSEGGYYCGQNHEFFALPASGHLLRLPDFEEYGIPEGETGDNGLKQWKASTLPVFPPDLLHPDWRFADERCAKLYDNIQQKLEKAESVYHMGDFDREGQLIVDNILNKAKYKGKVYRILPKSVTQAFLQEHFKKPEDNTDYATWTDAALARAVADQLFGLNLSRAFTIAAQRQGKDVLLTYGRVMTPTLNLVVMRDRLIEKFKPEIFFVPFATFQHEKGNFTAKWVKPEDFEGLSPEGNLTSIEERNKIIAAMKGASGVIIESGPKERVERPPLPYNLPDIQKDAFNLFGVKVDQTLEIMQTLYEQKLLTYPRTDSNYLHDTQFAEASAILEALSKFDLPQLKGKITMNKRHRAFDSKKVAAHTAIIPTGENPSSLSGVHKKIYDLVTLAYWRLFLPDRIYEEENIRVSAGGFEWQTKSAREITPGWTITGGGTSLIDNALPQGMKNKDAVHCITADFTEGKTTAPKHFTQASLLEAMRSIHKYESNPAFKLLLKETSGLGTPATQAETITKLAERGYVKTEKDFYISTPVARQFIDSIPEELRSPGLTALWEDDFKDVMSGTLSLETFLQKITTRLPGYCEQALSSSVVLGKASGEPCPSCGKPCTRKKKKDGGFFWSCLWCDSAFGDNEGKPGQKFGSALPTHPCVMSGCEGTMTQFTAKKANRRFWKCDRCETFVGGETTPDLPGTCPDCQGQVLRKTYLTEDKEICAWWKCAQCENSFDDEDGLMGKQRPAIPSQPCLLCAEGTIYKGKTQDDRFFWHCKTCKTYFNEKDGELVLPEACPDCGGKAFWALSKKGNEFWKCSSCGVFFKNKDGKPVPNDPGQPCPFKGCKGKVTRHIANSTGKPFWVCDTCKSFLNERVEGVFVSPVPCPSCGKQAVWGKKDDKTFWKCPSCETFFNDENGTPVVAASSGTGKKRPCPYKGCKGQMIQNASKEGGGFYWRCSTCKQYMNEYEGTPLVPVPCTEKKCIGTIVGGVSKKGNIYWKCNKCGTFFEDSDGKPGKKFEKK